MTWNRDDRAFMTRSLELARRGEGCAEPNPMVGCVIVRAGQVIGEGWHERYGGPHAEVNAIADAGDAAGTTMYVTLEPCCHHGKTPPCTEAVISAGVSRVVIAQRDPFAEVAGRGIQQLESAGIDVDVGLLEDDAQQLSAPYLKLVSTGRPWVIAKWAMTLDGKIATATGDSQWISNDDSRAVVHQLRGRVDAIVVGKGTVEADDPLLTARPPGPRKAARVVLATDGKLPTGSQLLRTIGDSPLVVATAATVDEEAERSLTELGATVVRCPGESYADHLASLLDELGRRRMTNVLLEGGAAVLGAAFDAGLVDEAWVFVAPKLIGGVGAPSPVGGAGVSELASSTRFHRVSCEQLGDDLFVRGFVERG